MANAVATLERHIARHRSILSIPLAETPDRIVPVSELTIRLGESRTTIWRRTRAGSLPQPVDGGYVARDLVAALPHLRGPQEGA